VGHTISMHYALESEKWLLKQAPHCAPVIFLRPLIIYISRQSQPMTATEMIIRVNLNFDLYFVSAQRNDNFCSVLLNLLHYQIL
jgi:hypothetical protein